MFEKLHLFEQFDFTSVFVVVIGFLGLVVLLNILGLSVIAKMLVDIVMSFFKIFVDGFQKILLFAVEHSYVWIVWFIKNLIGAHKEVLTNLTHTRAELDPAHEFKEKEKEV